MLTPHCVNTEPLCVTVMRLMGAESHGLMILTHSDDFDFQSEIADSFELETMRTKNKKSLNRLFMMSTFRNNRGFLFKLIQYPLNVTSHKLF